MNFKKIFLLVFLIIFLGTQAVKAQTVKIVNIINNSPAKALFTVNTQEMAIKPHSSKKMLSNIPYNELKKNLLNFIQDEPYIPENAIKLETCEGTFYIWCDHRGVIMAKAFEAGMSRLEAFPKPVLALSQSDFVLIGCLVTINPSGALNIQKA